MLRASSVFGIMVTGFMISFIPLMISQYTFGQIQGGPGLGLGDSLGDLFGGSGLNNKSLPLVTNSNVINTSSTSGTSHQNGSLVEDWSRSRVYTNDLHGISLSYPANWTAFSGFSYPDIVEFYSPLENLSDFLPPAQVILSITKFEETISFSDYTNRTLEALYASTIQGNQTNSTSGQAQGINSTKSSNNSDQAIAKNQMRPPLSVRSSDAVTVAGYPGHRVIYVLPASQDNLPTFAVMHMWIIVEGTKVYDITYFADYVKFLKYMPEVVEMINSLRISNSS